MSRPKKGTAGDAIASSRWRATMENKYGGAEELHRKMQELGRKGGKNGHTGGFGSDKVGADGLTGKQRARVAGSKGGAISKRGKAKSKEQIKLEHMPLIEQKRIAEQKKSAEQKKTFLQKLFGKK